MNALPQAIAGASIQSGTIAGKLNGVMPATTPNGWRMRVHVHAGGDSRRELTLEQVRDAAGELHDLDAALYLAPGVGRAPCRVRSR